MWGMHGSEASGEMLVSRSLTGETLECACSSMSNL